MELNVLLVTTKSWVAFARLAMAFQQLGVLVDAIGPTSHPIKATSAYGRYFRFQSLAPLRSIRGAIELSKPDIIIPADEPARSHLHRLHTWAIRQGAEAQALSALLERSLGDPAHYALIDTRTPLIELAREECIRTPETGVIRTLDELRSWIARNDLPVVLKTDGTSGGRGVKTANTPEEAEAAFRQLNRPPEAARAIKRALVDQDCSLLRPLLWRQRPLINVQAFIPGRDATIAVACWQGRILASIAVEVLETWKIKGPASVVRIINDPRIFEAAEKLVARLKLSGLCGFDFVVHNRTGEAHLIEMNPRATQTAHLPLGTCHNLPAALCAAAAGESAPETRRVTHHDVIALFPSEWQNNSASPYLLSAFHDVPWSEPRLVSLCVNNKLRDGGWLTYENLDKVRAWLFRRQSITAPLKHPRSRV